MNINYCHIKLRRADGASPHMDRSPCGDLTGAYVISPTVEEIDEIKCEASVGYGFPLCPICEAEYVQRSERIV